MILDVLVEIMNYLARWGHFIFGITWIGLLYFFNFVNGAYMAAASDAGKVDVVTKMLPKALWYFRWSAAFTFATGLVLLWFVMTSNRLGTDIIVGGLIATLMFLNVWLIIWPNQKIVIASNESVANGGDPDPGQADAAAKALLASRTNTLFSLPMLFFMGSSAHFIVGTSLRIAMWDLIVAVVIIALLELNAIFGKIGPMATVKGVISYSFALTIVLWMVVRLL